MGMNGAQQEGRNSDTVIESQGENDIHKNKQSGHIWPKDIGTLLSTSKIIYKWLQIMF